MDNTSEDFWVQYWDGSTWHTVATFTRGIDFDNGVFYHEVVSIPAGTYSYHADARLRFLCDASGNRDDVYIDEIEFRGLTARTKESNVEFLASRSSVFVPSEFSLSQNFPNPFRSSTATRIEFGLPADSDVRITVYNVAGQRVATLAEGAFPAGVHRVRWDPRGVASGTYFYRIQAGKDVETRKMLLLK
jgi:hypothetical protein